MRIRFGLSDHAEKLDQPIYFPMEHFMKHAFICGKTGSGKTVTLLN